MAKARLTGIFPLELEGRAARRCCQGLNDVVVRQRLQTKDLRRYALGGRTCLPRRVPRPAADLRQAGGVVLGLSRPPPRRGWRRCALSARPRQAPLSARLSARPFAPRTW